MQTVLGLWAVFHFQLESNRILHCDLLEDHILPYIVLLYVLYSAAQYTHGDLLVCYTIDIVALSAYLLLIGFASTVTR